MKNRAYNLNLNPELLYAIERRARAERSREIGRLFALLAKRIATLFRTPQVGKETCHA